MSRFAKVLTSLLDSSVNELPVPWRWCWNALMLMAYDADEAGFVRTTPEALARRANLDLADVTAALECFESPDAHSGTPADDGRRLRRVEGGWVLVNYERFREKERMDERREQIRAAVKRHRARGGDADRPPAEATPPPVEADGGRAVEPRVRVVGLDGQPRPSFTPSEWYRTREEWQSDVDALSETEDAIADAHADLGWEPTDRAEIRARCSTYKTRTGESTPKINPATMSHERLKLTLRDERTMLERARAELAKSDVADSTREREEAGRRITAKIEAWRATQAES